MLKVWARFSLKAIFFGEELKFYFLRFEGGWNYPILPHIGAFSGRSNSRMGPNVLLPGANPAPEAIALCPINSRTATLSIRTKQKCLKTPTIEGHDYCQPEVCWAVAEYSLDLIHNRYMAILTLVD